MKKKKWSYHREMDLDISKALKQAFIEHNITDDNDPRIDKVLDCITGSVIPNSAQVIVKTMIKKTPKLIRELKQDQKHFEVEINRIWGKALDLLQMYIHSSVEAGDNFNDAMRKRTTKENNYLIDVLTRLHGRGCRIASEIHHLLQGGYASAAYARWRTMHEIAVVAFFVLDNGNETARRYLLYDRIESYKSMILYQKNAAVLGLEAFSRDEEEEIIRIKDDLCREFGESFKSEYGWAAAIIKKPRIKFQDLEDAAGMGHVRPYYKLASQPVHASPKGVLFQVDLSPDEDIILTGPSTGGLVEPGSGAAYYLYKLNVALWSAIEHSFSNLVLLNVLDQLSEEVANAFLEAHQSIEKQ